jgi:HSP20 family protein
VKSACRADPALIPIDVSVKKGTLTVKGDKRDEREENENGQYRQERSYSAFESSIPFPVGVDEPKSKAEFKQGLPRLMKRPETALRRKKIVVSW